MESLTSPHLILIAGLPGTGKSTVARAFVQHYGGKHLNSDLQRNIMGLRGRYEPEDKKKVYEAILDSVRTGLLNGADVIVDSTFIRANIRESFESVARDCGIPFFWVEMHADENSIRERLKTPRTDSEADFSVFLALRAQSEPLCMPHLELWSDKMSLREMVQSIYNYTSSTSP